jgi:hypothetical protein
MTGSKEYSFWPIIKKSLGNRGCYRVALENIALIQGGSVSDVQGPTKAPTLLRNSARGAVARGSEGGSAAELQSRLIWACQDLETGGRSRWARQRHHYSRRGALACAGAPLQFHLCELGPAVPRGMGGSGSSRMESCAAHMTNTGNGPGQEGAGQQLKEVAGLSDSVSSVRKRRSEARCRPRAEGAVCFKFVRYPGRAACFKFTRYRPGQQARAGRRWIVAQGSYRSKRLNQFSQWEEGRKCAGRGQPALPELLRVSSPTVTGRAPERGGHPTL